MNHASNSPLQNSPLGQEVAYPTHYDPTVLFGISRALNRSGLSLPESWHGADIWNAYEVSWLNARGKPVVALARFEIPCDSPNIIESKSLKLYLNSFNQDRFPEWEPVRQRMQADLSQVAGAPVDVRLEPLNTASATLGALEGRSIDELDIDIDAYRPQAELLRLAPGEDVVTETLVSDLLKSNCPVTGQPDWGSVQVSYSGLRIDEESLLRYIVSLREHTEFHEHCVERLYSDIWALCKPSRLLVYARYTRRGGLDINPWRSSHPARVQEARLVRQ